MLDLLLVILITVSVIFAVVTGNTRELSAASLDGSKKAITLCLELAGSMALWGGIMNVSEKCGINRKITKLLSLPLSLVFKDIRMTRAFRYISLNTGANLLGLGNAATPTGLKAMKELSAVNKDKGRETAMFVLLNTASIQLVPVTVAALRLSHGSRSPWETMLPTVITSACALAAGTVMVYILYPKGAKEYGDNGTSDDGCHYDYGSSKADGHRGKLLQRC